MLSVLDTVLNISDGFFTIELAKHSFVNCFGLAAPG